MWVDSDESVIDSEMYEEAYYVEESKGIIV